jgi:hypothetical protein
VDETVDPDEVPEGSVLFVIGNDQCVLDEGDATWLAQELRVGFPASGGPAPARAVADRIEQMLVGDRWGVLPLDRAEVVQIHALLAARTLAGPRAALRDALAKRLSSLG